MSDIFERARNVPIDDVLRSRHVIEARQRNKYACVACESSDAMHVYYDGNKAHCFSCGGDFSPIDIVMHIDGVDALPAAKMLLGEDGGDTTLMPTSSPQHARRASRRPSDGHSQSKQSAASGTRHRVLNAMYPDIGLGDDGANYLSARGIDPSLASLLGVGAGDGRHWHELRGEYTEQELTAAGLLNSRGGIHPHYARGFLVFTYFTSDGGAVDSYRFRRIYEDSSHKMLALCGPGPKEPYLASVSVPQARKSDGVLYVVEGELDALSINQVGRWAIATPGASVWKHRWCEGWEQLRVVVLADADEAGLGLAERIARSALKVQGAEWVERNLELCTPSAVGADPNDLLQEGRLDQQLSKLERAFGA